MLLPGGNDAGASRRLRLAAEGGSREASARRLALVMVVMVMAAMVSGCHRSEPADSSGPSPYPDRIHALLQADVPWPPKAGDTRDIPQSPAGKAMWRAAQEDDIREAVLRVGFDYYQGMFFPPKARQRRFDRCTLFVSINQKDPSDAFLKRFSDIKAHLLKASAAKGRKFGRASLDTLGDVGWTNIGAISWANDTSVVVDWGYSVAPRAAGGLQLGVVRKQGRWVVVTIKGMWAT